MDTLLPEYFLCDIEAEHYYFNIIHLILYKITIIFLGFRGSKHLYTSIQFNKFAVQLIRTL